MLQTNNLVLRFNYVLVLLFAVCVYAENEFGLKHYDMRRQQISTFRLAPFHTPRDVERWKTRDGFDGLNLSAGLRSGDDRLQQKYETCSVSMADRCSPRSTAGESI